MLHVITRLCFISSSCAKLQTMSITPANSDIHLDFFGLAAVSFSKHLTSNAMIHRYPGICLQTASSFSSHHVVALHVTLASRSGATVRSYATQPPPKAKAHSTAQKTLVEALTPARSHDLINPPRSTLPPSLELPTRGGETVAVYYFRIGKAYGNFYKEGVKAVWRNYKLSKELKTRVFRELDAKGSQERRIKKWRKVREAAVKEGLVTRAEFQLLERNASDIGKLPFFGLLVLLFGEWLPLLVPFMPHAVPGTCRIPKQVKGMREKGEERRRKSFRQGIPEPTAEQAQIEGGQKWPLAQRENAGRLVSRLRDEQLVHLSCVFGLHSTIWDRVQLTPPMFLLRWRIKERVQYLSLDDVLLVRDGGLDSMKQEEVVQACEERGQDVLNKPDDQLRKLLVWWVERQREDQGRGTALLDMLFRRYVVTHITADT